ncbi:MAG: CHAT domain-containing protein [Thermoanaerobaculia bacterium]
MTPDDLILLERLAAHACSGGRWYDASKYCERYLELWRTAAPRVPTPSRASDARLQFLTNLGKTAAMMHEKGLLHGTLLLENITADGALKNFTGSRTTDPEFNALLKGISESATAEDAEVLRSHIDALPKDRQQVCASLMECLEDLRPLRYQLTTEEWSAFEAGYSGTGSHDVLAALSGESPKVADYPVLPLRAPSLTLRMCMQLLREHGFAIKADEPVADFAPDEATAPSAPDVPVDEDHDEDERGAPEVRAFSLPEAVLTHIRRRDWFRAAGALRMHLDEAELESPESPYCLFLAAKYASMLLQCAEFLPNQTSRLAAEVRDLLSDYGELIRECAKRARGNPGSEASNANSLGWAAVKLSHYLRDGKSMLRSGADLLEVAVEAAPRAVAPESYSIYANNLAMAYLKLSGFEADEGAGLLHQAADLMREVQAIDREFLRSGNRAQRAVGETLYIDLANLSRVCMALGMKTYDATWINRKPLESARWFREALDTALESSHFAARIGRIENVADADILSANIYIWLCRQYMTERRWAGGDVTRAFYDWLCEFGGGWVNTGQFVRDCTASALEHLSRAAHVGIDRNPSVLVEAIDAMVALWALSSWEEGVPVDIGRHSLLSLLEFLRRLDDNGMLNRFIDEGDQVRGLKRYLEQVLVLDGYQAGLCKTKELAAAQSALDQLSHSTASVARALARPYRTAIQFEETPSGIVLNGLVLEPREDYLSMRLASVRRDVRIDGLALLDANCVLENAAFLKSLSAQAIGHLQPMMNWGDLPDRTAILRGTAMAGESRIGFEVLRLPTGSWPSWLLRFALNENAGPLRLSLGFLGVYDRESGTLRDEFPARLERAVDVLVFGAEGVSLEIAALFPDEPVEVRVAGDRATPEIRIGAGEITMLLKSTPRITSSDVFFAVSSSHADLAACCATSFHRAAPSIAFPAGALQAYTPLFFFTDRLSPDAITLLNEGSTHEIVLAGMATTPADTVDLLLDLYDPRRELLWFVDESEAEAAKETLRRFEARVSSVPGSTHLLAWAASVTLGYRMEDFVQLFIVPRDLTTAAIQMALDLAALRRWDSESVPVAVNGQITYLNVKGNSMVTRLAASVRGVATFEELGELYFKKYESSPMGKMVLRQEGADDRLVRAVMPALPKRTVLLFSPDKTGLAALVPYARILGAFLVPANETGLRLLRRLRPDAIYVPEDTAVPSGGWRHHSLPADPLSLAQILQELVRSQHEQVVLRLEHSHPHLLPSRVLIEEMRPAKYLVVAMLGGGDRAWAYVAANYAASVRAPLYLFASPLTDLAKPELTTKLDLLREQRTRGLGTAPPEPQYAAADFPAVERLCANVAALEPAYIGFVSPRADYPIEFIGSPALGTRFPIGRLAGPDLDSTCLLVAKAALSEEFERPGRIRAIVAESHDAVPGRVLPGAAQEARALAALLGSQPDVDSVLVSGANDRSRFIERAAEADLVHFAGHGEYTSGDPERTGLVFNEGILNPETIREVFERNPIVFANACDTGKISNAGDVRQHWTGLAASFIHRGAVNYLGSLWPVFDDGSRRFAEEFYREVCAGRTVGEAVLAARADAYARGDVTWAAFALFGCPRVRLRPGRIV